jgi:hypothetical protein
MNKTKQDGLIDIRTIKVDRNLPRKERIQDYIKQIKNPYKYKCGKWTIKAVFTENGVPIEDCLYHSAI